MFFLAAGIDNGTDPCTMTRFVNLVSLTSDITRNAIDALHLYNNGTEQVTLKNILFTRTDLPELGRITFNGEENSEMPIGRTDTENYSVAANEDFFISGRIEGKLLNTSQKDEGERWLGFSVWQAGIWEGWWGTKNDTSGAHGGFKDDGKGNVGLQWAGQGDGTWPWVDVDVTREDLENGKVWFGFGRIDNRLFLCAWKEGGAKVFNVIPGYDSQMTKLAGALTIGKYAPGTRGTLLDVSFVTGSDVPENLMTVTTSVASSEHGKAEIVTQNVALGGELKIVVTPDADYRLDSLTVNGKDYKVYSGVQAQREGEKVTVTFPSWIADKAVIAAVFEKIDYIVPSVTTAENGTVTVSDRIPVGDDLVISLVPDEGYMFSSLTINDKDYSEYKDATLVYNGENVTVTIPAWAEKNAAISAAFAQIQRSDVSFKVTVSDPYALQQPNVADVNVYLVSERTGAEIKVNPAADGTVKFGQLVNGKYTLRIDGAGYPSYTVEVGGTLNETYEFVRHLVATGDGVALDGTEVTISQDNRDAQIAYEVAADSDFMLTAGVSAFAANSENDAIVGLYAMTGAGDEVGNAGGTVNKVMGGIYLKADGVYLQFVGTEQSGVRLPDEYQEAFKAGTLRIALGRAQSVWFLAAAVGEGEFTRFVDAARVTSSLISMGGFTLGLYNSGTAQVSLTLGLEKENVPVKGILVYDETGHDEIAYGRTQAANWNVSAGEDFYISARLAGELTNADGSGAERKLGFAVWEKDKWEGWWATDPDTSGVRGGIKVGTDGIAGLEWSGDNNWSWLGSIFPRADRKPTRTERSSSASAGSTATSSSARALPRRIWHSIFFRPHGMNRRVSRANLPQGISSSASGATPPTCAARLQTSCSMWAMKSHPYKGVQGLCARRGADHVRAIRRKENAVPQHALDLYYWTNGDEQYLKELYAVLRAHDEYLWKWRDPAGRGCLQSWCVWDTGEDNSVRFGRAQDSWEGETPMRALRSEISSSSCAMAEHDRLL